jgi:hypothetical protein
MSGIILLYIFNDFMFTRKIKNLPQQIQSIVTKHTNGSAETCLLLIRDSLFWPFAFHFFFLYLFSVLLGSWPDILLSIEYRPTFLIIFILMFKSNDNYLITTTYIKYQTDFSLKLFNKASRILKKVFDLWTKVWYRLWCLLYIQYWENIFQIDLDVHCNK